jgi:hypothetical protein
MKIKQDTTINLDELHQITVFYLNENPSQQYIRLEDTFNIAKLGIKAIKDVILQKSFDKDEFNSYFDRKLIQSGELEKALIENFNKVGIIITKE